MILPWYKVGPAKCLINSLTISGPIFRSEDSDDLKWPDLCVLYISKSLLFAENFPSRWFALFCAADPKVVNEIGPPRRRRLVLPVHLKSQASSRSKLFMKGTIARDPKTKSSSLFRFCEIQAGSAPGNECN